MELWWENNDRNMDWNDSVDNDTNNNKFETDNSKDKDTRQNSSICKTNDIGNKNYNTFKIKTSCINCSRNYKHSPVVVILIRNRDKTKSFFSFSFSTSFLLSLSVFHCLYCWYHAQCYEIMTMWWCNVGLLNTHCSDMKWLQAVNIIPPCLMI